MRCDLAVFQTHCHHLAHQPHTPPPHLQHRQSNLTYHPPDPGRATTFPLLCIVGSQSPSTAMRPLKACLQCRTGKRKCDRNADSAKPCTQCARRRIKCSATIASDAGSSPPLPEPPKSLPPAPSFEEIHLVDLYFRFIHNQPHSLFHESSFRQSFMEGRASRPVLLGMMGMSAR